MLLLKRFFDKIVDNPSCYQCCSIHLSRFEKVVGYDEQLQFKFCLFCGYLKSQDDPFTLFSDL